jgi:hypothetical protein
MFDLLTPDQWDSLRSWLATIGGLVALLIAANTYRRNVRIKREEQARLVYSKFQHVKHHDPGATFPLLPNGAKQGSVSPGMQIVKNPARNAGDSAALGRAIAPLIQTTVIIHNGSKELIGPARVQMVNGGTGRTWDEFSISVGAVDPESDYVVGFTWINKVHPGQPSLASTVIFRDASGQWWRRHRAEPIERVHDDPENTGPTATERIGTRLSQEAMGIPEARRVTEPKLSARTRWHRFWRKCRGLTPIP